MSERRPVLYLTLYVSSTTEKQNRGGMNPKSKNKSGKNMRLPQATWALVWICQHTHFLFFSFWYVQNKLHITYRYVMYQTLHDVGTCGQQRPRWNVLNSYFSLLFFVSFNFLPMHTHLTWLFQHLNHCDDAWDFVRLSGIKSLFMRNANILCLDENEKGECQCIPHTRLWWIKAKLNAVSYQRIGTISQLATLRF